MRNYLAVKKVSPDFTPDLKSIKQNATEMGVKVHHLAFNRQLHKMYCLCQSPSENEIRDHLEKLGIQCDEIVEVQENDLPPNLDVASNLVKAGQIIANFSHDMRQAMSVASINSQLIRAKLKPEEFESIEPQISRIRDSITKMKRQVNEVLDFVRVAPLVKKEISVNKLLENAVSEFEHENVCFRLPQNRLAVKCDGEKMQSVFSNIIANAISVKAKTIEIHIDEKQNHIKIQFVDDGPGIPKGKIDQIFEPLFTTRPTGTGLGLSICKSIVEQHDGEIKASNNPTTFTIMLPKN